VVFFSPRGVFLCTPENGPCFTAETSKRANITGRNAKNRVFFVQLIVKNGEHLPPPIFKKKSGGWKIGKF
jgi:hypothetical protein